MSQEGYDKLVAQLKEMETIERPAASQPSQRRVTKVI